MAAGIADHVWTLREIAGLLDSNWPTTDQSPNTDHHHEGALWPRKHGFSPT
jgi:hypothetical protein